MSESIEADRIESMSIDDAWAAVQTGLNYVSWLARDFRYTGVAREDLEAEGRLGLFEAALRFDPSHGAQFLTYASFWSRRRMQAYVARHARVVRRPAHRVGGPRDPDDVSLDQPVSSGSAVRWSDVLVDSGAPRPLETLVGAEDAALIVSATHELPSQWRAIIVRRFGLDGGHAMTLAAVGETLGLSRERVRQLEAKAMARLRALLEEAWGRAQARELSPREMTTAAARSPLTFSVVRHMSRNLSTPKMMPIPSGGTPTMPSINATTGSEPAGTPAVPMPPNTQMPTTISCRAKPNSTP
jgi:RNA polymerase sigma factor (sigma-70 family)